MTALVQQRCSNHLEREAVARCPECGNFFCRECIVEHDDRVLCADCLRRISATRERRGNRFAGAMRVGQLACSLLAAWLFFYFAGRILLTIPTSFHDGTFWQSE